MTCTVHPCGRARTTQVEAGLHLGLCDHHLNRLRRMCKGKNRIAYPKLATREVRRLTETGASRRTNRRPAAYHCKLCTTWHVGHQLVNGDGHGDPDARDAAAAVRTTLTTTQLNTLTTAWKPHTRQPAGTTTA